MKETTSSGKRNSEPGDAIISEVSTNGTTEPMLTQMAERSLLACFQSSAMRVALEVHPASDNTTLCAGPKPERIVESPWAAPIAVIPPNTTPSNVPMIVPAAIQCAADHSSGSTSTRSPSADGHSPHALAACFSAQAASRNLQAPIWGSRPKTQYNATQPWITGTPRSVRGVLDGEAVARDGCEHCTALSPVGVHVREGEAKRRADGAEPTDRHRHPRIRLQLE